ncbi:MAG: response regulator transcription factor [Euzebyaceae bacterium]|nr:response regulator transcription factor [Euzebyaceae bacterium]
MSQRIVLADDQELIRNGFKMLLHQAGHEVVGEAKDGSQAVEMARALRPDIVLMDVRMPVMDGIEATRLLAGPDVKDPVRVLVLTTFDLDEHVYDSLRAGASGYLLKDTPTEQLLHAIEVVVSGQALLAPTVTRRLVERYATQPAIPDVDRATLERLTVREREVLRLIAHGMSNAEIATHLTVAESTVKTHVANVLMKLHLRDRVQAVVAAYETGLVRAQPNT